MMDCVMVRDSRERMIAANYRNLHEVNGTNHCEVCNWKPPKVPTGMVIKRRLPGLECHHIDPRSDRRERAGNLVLLCPNHHATADMLTELWWKGQRGPFVPTRQQLINLLHLIEKHPT